MSTTDRHRLDAANILLGQELWSIHSSLAVYRVIGLNAGAIRNAGFPGGFFGFVQNQSLSAVALGLGKVFEREQEGKFELCSLSGVYRLAKAVQIENAAAAAAFAKRHGTIPSTDWIRDLDEVSSHVSGPRSRLTCRSSTVSETRDLLISSRWPQTRPLRALQLSKSC
jgi:hypothetical protein